MTTPSLPTNLQAIHRDGTFELIFESTPVAMIIVNRSGEIVLANAQTEKSFGYLRDELVEQPIEILIPEQFRERHPQQRDHYFQNAHVRKMGIGLDLFAVRKDGSEFPVDISLHPLEVEGQPFVLAHVVDVTEQKLAESQAAFRETLEALRFMVEHLPAGAVYVQPDRIVMNRAVEIITGYGRDEIATIDDWFQILFRETEADVRELYEADQLSGFAESRTLTLTTKNGGRRHVQFVAHRYDHHEVWLLHDITNLKAAEQKLVQSERLAAIGQMMAALAHESRNAIQRGQACLEMMELDLDGQDELLELNTRTRQALSELNRLYEEVRGYAAPMQLDRAVCDLDTLCRTVWAQISETRNTQSVRFQVETNGVDCHCNLDSPRVSQVIRNVLENSLAACGDDARIAISITEKDCGESGALELRFTDNGPGVSSDQAEQLFEPFFTTKSKGTGLGMAIAKRIVEAHGGTIEMENVGQSGATFLVTLPR